MQRKLPTPTLMTSGMAWHQEPRASQKHNVTPQHVQSLNTMEMDDRDRPVPTQLKNASVLDSSGTRPGCRLAWSFTHFPLQQNVALACRRGFPTHF